MSDPVEWDCEGCGQHVVAFGIDAVPSHGFCATCEFLCEFITDPSEIEGLRRSRHMYPFDKGV